MTLEFHPIANCFPLIEGAEFAVLAADIEAHGVREPIWLYEGKILDGRNRYLAAQDLGKLFLSREFAGSPLEAIDFVWSSNRARRHLTPSQAAICDARRSKLMDIYAPVREAATKRMHGGRPKASEKPPEQIPEDIKPSPADTRDIRARAAGTNAKYIDIADKLINERPDLAEEVAKGDKTLSQVARDLRREKLAAHNPPAPVGKYRVLYADPPWKYNDAMAISATGLSENYGPAEAHFPPMTIAELCALPIKDIADNNAVLFFWVTSPLLEDCFSVIRAWGFKYKTSFIWDKVDHNMGHYNSVRHELLLVCTRGSCLPDVPKLFDSVVEEKRGRHSAKPEQFRTIIDTIYPIGARIELFRRGVAPDGWTVWGNEANATA